ncbi:hypothetical protein I0Q12_18850 [Rhodococcus sp. CX]|uniref:hypothetical protein n=1 Tax=Rhodococcus sp. CX TaxID=2789880 RepID=UPI0018CE1E56|nr:hypothetical protein [Rhodococcus sp. CX]MBH0121453.1 hypothetical protein [Rhodococcus sp. CX]
MGNSDDAWRELAHRVERLDAEAGRALHAALRTRDRPPTVQIVERAGSGAETLAVPEAPEEYTVEHLETDVPGRADPIVDGDVVILVTAVRRPPHAIHPADRALIDRVEAGRVIVVLTGTDPADDAAIGAVAERLRTPVLLFSDTDALASAIAARLHRARRRRDDVLATTVAGLAATPPARDAIEDALDTLAPGRAP